MGDDWAVIVPAGVWHNVVNTGSGELEALLALLAARASGRDGPRHEGRCDGGRAGPPRSLSVSEAERLFGDEHVRRYRETDGAVGHIWRRGAKILLLTTRGRKTGEPRTAPLIYESSPNGYVIVASNGGAQKHPGWYRNLLRDPTSRCRWRATCSRRGAYGDGRGAGGALAARGATVAPVRRVPDEDEPRDPGRRPRAALTRLRRARARGTASPARPRACRTGPCAPRTAG